MSENEIVIELAEIFVQFCMPRECFTDALVFAQEAYDVVVRPQLHDAWMCGRVSDEGDTSPFV